MDFVSCKHRKGLATALKELHHAPNAAAADQSLAAFETGLRGTRYPAIDQSCRCAWTEVSRSAPSPTRSGIIYTTNFVEAINSKLRKAVRTHGRFFNDEAATQLLYLILNRSAEEWRMPPHKLTTAKAQFAVTFGERFIKAMAPQCSSFRSHTRFLTVPTRGPRRDNAAAQGLAA